MTGVDELRLPAERVQRIADEAAMKVDLFLAHLHAQAAAFDVTRRAELYVRVVGLPLPMALEALQTDEAGWRQRLSDLRDMEARSRAAWSARDPSDGAGTSGGTA